MKKNLLGTLVVFIILFSGCSQKQEQQEYNKPAIYWYNKMIKQITNYQLDEADDTFISLESEHKKSPLLPTAMMIIAYAHMQEDEYVMANFYLDAYLKKFSSSKNVDYIRYLKIKTNFLAFKNQYREQELLIDTLKDIDKFLVKYKNSSYRYLIETIKARLLMAKSLFDAQIADLYTRLDKPKAAQLYKKREKQSWSNIKEIKKVHVPWYRALFE
jgi:outer membrane protein assembly factor BamD